MEYKYLNGGVTGPRINRNYNYNFNSKMIPTLAVKNGCYKHKCFCNSFNFYVWIGCLTGVLPVKISVNRSKNLHISNPKNVYFLVKSKFWYGYSLVFISIYLPQILVSQVTKFSGSGTKTIDDIDW